MKQIILALNGRAGEVEINKLEMSVAADTAYMLDFNDVEDIDFTGIRALIRLSQKGLKFQLINVSDAIGSILDTAGVSRFFTYVHKPAFIDLTGYEVTGESFMAKTYNLSDNLMVKMYNDDVPTMVPLKEKMTARAALMFGLNTPISGRLMTDGKRFGLSFERIQGKRSFARAISQEPDRLEYYARRFAQMAKELHSRQCDTTMFGERSETYRNAVLEYHGISDSQREKMLAFIDSVPKTTTCIHGDLHIGNVITNGKDELWIDLGDFSYGNPMWDMAMLYFQSHNPNEEMVMDLYHISCAQFRQVWDYYVEEYFGAVTAQAKSDLDSRFLPFVAIQMVYLLSIVEKDMSFLFETINKAFPA